MWFELSSKKVAWMCSRTKRYNIPTSDTAETDKIANAYWKQYKMYEHLNLLAWLRVVDNTKKPPSNIQVAQLW